MTRRTDVLLWITLDDARDVALVTGRGNLRTVLDNADLREHARWSRSGHGWIIPSGKVPDLVAWCEYQGIPCRTRRRPTEPETS